MLAGRDQRPFGKAGAEILHDGRGDKLGMGVVFAGFQQRCRRNVVLDRVDLDTGELRLRAEEVFIGLEYQLAGIEIDAGQLEWTGIDGIAGRYVPVGDFLAIFAARLRSLGDRRDMVAQPHEEDRIGFRQGDDDRTFVRRGDAGNFLGLAGADFGIACDLAQYLISALVLGVRHGRDVPGALDVLGCDLAAVREHGPSGRS
jgi:hypothetical protein